MATSKKASAAGNAATLSASAAKKLAKKLAAEKLAAEKLAVHEPHCSVKTLQLVSSYVDDTVRTASSLKFVIDGFVSDGITLEDLSEPKPGEDRGFWESLRTAVRNGFTKEVRALIAIDANTEGWSKEKMAERRYWSMQIGSKIKDLRGAYDRRLKKAADAAAKEEAKTKGPDAIAALKADDAVKALAELKASIAKVCANYVARIEKSTATWEGAAKCKTALRAAVRAAS
jgi:hypothetical protein